MTDVLVLGGGLIGCLCALRLRARGLSVTVVDRGELGGEASSAAGGILAPQVEAHEPGPFLELALASRAEWPRLVASLRAALDRGGPAELADRIGYRTEGTLAVALDDHEAEALEARLAWQSAAGLPVERLTPEELALREPALAPVKAALWFPRDHQVDAQHLMQAVAHAVRLAQVAVHRGHVRRVLVERPAGARSGGRAVGADVDGERLLAGQVVLALGSWSSLTPDCGVEPDAVVPVRGQMMELPTRPGMLRHLVFGDEGYLVPRTDGRLVCGSTTEHAGYSKDVTSAGLMRLRARLERLCPALADLPAPTYRTWAGLRPATRDGLPLLGPTAIDGLCLATGHYRNGILLAPITAAIVEALVLGRQPPVDLRPFSPARLAA